MVSQPTRTTTPLPPFKYNWTGNDINGLHALAATVYGYVPPSLGVAHKLDRTVNELVQAASWQGQAAEQFRGAWLRDSAEILECIDLMNAGGAIFDKVAVELAWIQNWWESLDPSPAKAHQDGWAAATPKIREATGSAAIALNGLSRRIAATAKRFINDATISAANQTLLKNEMRVSLGGSPRPPVRSVPGKPLDQVILGSHTVTDLAGFGAAGASLGAVIGGGVGVVGGPFAEVTVPAGAGVGGAIGMAVGGAVGGVWGLGEDLHIW